MEASSTKTCIVCHSDCTNKPRIKDSQGRYCCKDCAERKKAAKQSAASSPTPATLDAPPEEPVLSMDLLAEEANAQAKVATDQVIDLAPVSPDSLPAEQRGKAPNLRHSGLDTNRLKPTKCQQCGYDMKGLESLRCPECGAICRPPDKLDYLREESRKLAIKTWVTPIVGTVVCLAISFGMLGAAGGTWLHFIALSLDWIVMVPVGLLAFWISTLIFLEFDAPWGLTALRFAAIQAFLTIPTVVFFAMGFPFGFNLVGGLLGLALMTFLYAWVLEMETTDALWLALIQQVVSIATMLLLRIAVESAFGGP